MQFAAVVTFIHLFHPSAMLPFGISLSLPPFPVCLHLSSPTVQLNCSSHHSRWETLLKLLQMHLGGDLSVVPQSEPGSSVNWCDEKAICSNGSGLECSPPPWSALLVMLNDEARWLLLCLLVKRVQLWTEEQIAADILTWHVGDGVGSASCWRQMGQS